MGTAPPSPGLTAVEDDHTQHIPEHNFKPKPAGHATQPVSANHIDVSTIEKGDTINTHPVTGPVPDPSLDPDAKTGKEHVQLERTNPDLYRKLSGQKYQRRRKEPEELVEWKAVWGGGPGELVEYLGVSLSIANARFPIDHIISWWPSDAYVRVATLQEWGRSKIGSGSQARLGRWDSVCTSFWTLPCVAWIRNRSNDSRAPQRILREETSLPRLLGNIHALSNPGPSPSQPRTARADSPDSWQSRRISRRCWFVGISRVLRDPNTGGVVHDCFDIAEGGYAVGIYTLSSVIGPPVGNALCGFFTQNVGEFNLFWFFLGLFGFHWFVILLLLPETRDIMTRKASTLRKDTGIGNIYAEHELDKKKPSYLWKTALPLTYLSAGINGFAYGMIFLSNEAFPLVFGEGNNGHNWMQ
ncbi:hypothetical protein QFC20_004915 [Naganishia adeliensis]|uniref:Uncharacterized protein n=1 Tax=Naganishia adeliensis TaxID=92952 RepID=A0ACC2VUE3_9TREE|nr:hypothetical protein QFC20_004915 [Naganishia adeliensis]